MIGGLVLIAAGVMLLLTNLGLTDTGVWLGMLTLWPVVVIAVGVGLIIPREAHAARAGVAGLTLVALIAGAWVIEARELPARGRRAEVEVPLGEAARADVDLEIGAARMHVRGGADEDHTVTGTVGLTRGQRLVAEGGVSEGTSQVRVAAEGRWFRMGVNPDRVAPWDVRLTDQVPLQVRITSGVGEIELDLRGLDVEEARIDLGVGRTVTHMPDEGTPRVRIDGGAGETVLRLPLGIPARVAVDTGLGATSVEGTFLREGDVYTTIGWEDADERLDVTIATGVGSVKVIRE